MIFRIFDRTLETLLVLALAAMGTIVSANVFCRFVLDFSIYWGDEAAQSLLVWLTFLGAAIAAIAVRDRSHYAFDWFASYAAGSARLALSLALLSRIVTLGAVGGLFLWSAEVAIEIHPWIMPAMGISRSWVYAAGPSGSAFMFLYLVRDLILVLREHSPPPASTAAT
jgi:TRAP-type C4-dicarboxylate transport system permease small subunit